MKIVGLTGGIGAGKTTVSRIFRLLGMPIYTADERSKAILDKDLFVRNKVVEIFGEKSYIGDVADRKFLAEKCFSNSDLLAQLNGILHPAVASDFASWRDENSNASYLIKEAAILFESGSYKDCDNIIMVTAPEEVRITRVQERDEVSAEEVKARIAHQWPEERKLDLADVIIENVEDQSLIQQVMKIHNLWSNENT